MRYLYVVKPLLWPRFRAPVHNELKEHQLEVMISVFVCMFPSVCLISVLKKKKKKVVELHLKLTPNMKQLQEYCIDLMQVLLLELKKSTTVNLSGITIENGLFNNFERALRRELDPYWYNLTQETRNLVTDLGQIRRLLSYIVKYDCVTLHRYLTSLKTVHSIQAQKHFFGTANNNKVLTSSAWLMTTTAEELFQTAKNRVYEWFETDPRPEKTELAKDFVPLCNELDLTLEPKSKRRKVVVSCPNSEHVCESDKKEHASNTESKEETVMVDKDTQEHNTNKKDCCDPDDLDDQGDHVFQYQNGFLRINLEVNPKWQCLLDIIRDIRIEQASHSCSIFIFFLYIFLKKRGEKKQQLMIVWTTEEVQSPIMIVTETVSTSKQIGMLLKYGLRHEMKNYWKTYLAATAHVQDNSLSLLNSTSPSSSSSSASSASSASSSSSSQPTSLPSARPSSAHQHVGWDQYGNRTASSLSANDQKQWKKLEDRRKELLCLVEERQQIEQVPFSLCCCLTVFL
ncbi:DNA repair protein RAD1 [Reticulomyxa filosa]|uniref:DNA repair protein RAD1 n=1 Tax=Reticulomyxa filosa TaxID=46433 RepID=X6M6Q5_RETFI|nr:DNA repair protein RAD1 [Reticulomyxa filosa]|eukprot:ETO09147.1 DNA repair protein RAD1 [Reticulomyxa filosa]